MKRFNVTAVTLCLLVQFCILNLHARKTFGLEAPAEEITYQESDSPEQSPDTRSLATEADSDGEGFFNKTYINEALLWFLFGLAMAFLEFIVPGVILIFFGIGALIVALTTLLGLTGTFNSQLISFALLSILLLVCLRRWIKGKFYGHVSDVQDLDQIMDEFSGKKVAVTKDIIPGSLGGEVEFKGAAWQAVSNVLIKSGELGVIRKVDGVTLHIEKDKGE